MTEAGITAVVRMRDEASDKMERFGKTIQRTGGSIMDFRMAMVAIGGLVSHFAAVLARLDSPVAKTASDFLRTSGYIMMTAGSILYLIPVVQKLIATLRSMAMIQAVLAALSGPKGWASLALAAAVGAGAYFGTKALMPAPVEEKPAVLAERSKQILQAITQPEVFFRGKVPAGFQGIKLAPEAREIVSKVDIKIEGGPIFLNDEAAMARFAKAVSEQQRKDARRTTGRLP